MLVLFCWLVGREREVDGVWVGGLACGCMCVCGVVMFTYFYSACDDGGDESLPDFDGVPGEFAWAGHGWLVMLLGGSSFGL